MIREITRDTQFLSRPSQPATQADLYIAKDLLDTLSANADMCVGMAANMIGESKCIIVVSVGYMNIAMINPEITKCSGSYMTEEGCLSLPGVRPTERFRNIEVSYRDLNWKKVVQKFSGFTAQIIQHEVDHLSGRLI